MADDAPASPFGNPPVVAPAPVIEPPVTNPEAVRDMGLGFLAKHEASMADRSREVDNIFSKQQLTVDNMSKMLDDTTASLKRAREGRSNLPLMALGAGMLSGTGNFGQQLGAGLKAMVPAIQQQRGDDEDFQYKLASLAMKRAGVENAPLQDKLAYLRALQTGDQASIRSTEAALLKASGQTEKAGAKADMASDVLEEKKHKDAMAAALAQIKQFGEGHYTTPEARQEAFLSAYEQAARGFKISEQTIKTYVEAQRKIYGASQPKGGFTTPGDTPDDIKKAMDLGLGPKPVGYTYDSYPNPTDRQKAYQIERANYEKETKDQQVELQNNLGVDRDLERALSIMERHPGITGRTAGVLRDARYPTTATDELDAIFKKNQVHSVPQGQGAISNFERELFEKAKPNMNTKPDANRNLIAVQRQIINDQIEKRKFINTYFGHYKTTMGADDMWAAYARSKEGRAGFDDPQTGMVVPNPARIPWQEWMRKQHGAPPQSHAEGGMHRSEAVHLGEEWDG